MKLKADLIPLNINLIFAKLFFEQHGYKYCKLIIKNYIFIYTIDEDTKVIYLMRIFHELEDYENKFVK